MINFNNLIRQAGIRALVRNEIRKSIGITFEQASLNIQAFARAFSTLGAHISFAGLSMDDFEKQLKIMKQDILIYKIKRRIRIFDFINWGILKLWIGG